MHERKKLRETQYFYSKMIEEQEQGHKEYFKYNLSAFLSSARSVLQYALEETKSKSKGQKWYDNRILTNPVLKFLKDKRDNNIHIEPIQPRADQKLQVTDNMHISDSSSITTLDKDGNIKEQDSSGKPEEPMPKKPKTSPVTEVKYKFNDWSGSEDVLELCRSYVQELENAIEDGVNKGFITG